MYDLDLLTNTSQQIPLTNNSSCANPEILAKKHTPNVKLLGANKTVKNRKG